MGRQAGYEKINWNFAYLNSVHIPTPTQIMQAQKQAALTHAMSSKTYRSFLNSVNQDFFSTYKFDPTATMQIISAIQKTLEMDRDAALYSTGFLKSENYQDEQKLIATLRKNEALFQNTVIQLQQIYSHFKINETGNRVPFPAKVSTQLNNLDNVIKQLSADLSSIKTEYPLIDMQARKSQETGKMGYLARTQNIGYELKGFLLPLEAIKHYNQYIEKTGVTFIETGAWRDQHGKEIPVDIFGVSNSSSINFSGLINGARYDGPLSGVISALEKIDGKTQNISIQVDNWDSLLAQLQSQNAMLIQSKASKKMPPINGRFSINLEKIIQNRQSKEANALARLISLKRVYQARILASHEQYNLLFSYELSKYMDSILGYENNIILSPRGFLTLDEWARQEFSQNYYQPRFRLSLNSDKDIPIASF